MKMNDSPTSSNLITKKESNIHKITFVESSKTQPQYPPVSELSPTEYKMQRSAKPGKVS